MKIFYQNHKVGYRKNFFPTLEKLFFLFNFLREIQLRYFEQILKNRSSDTFLRNIFFSGNEYTISIRRNSAKNNEHNFYRQNNVLLSFFRIFRCMSSFSSRVE